LCFAYRNVLAEICFKEGRLITYAAFPKKTELGRKGGSQSNYLECAG
jgi:hypothetical protein